MAGRHGPLGPQSPIGSQSLSISHSLPSLGSAKIGAEGSKGALPKGISTTGGLGNAGTRAQDIHVAKLRGGWRGASEETRTQEVCRHLEWARGMKASYERQVALYEQELQSELEEVQLLQSPKRQQGRQRQRPVVDGSSPKRLVDVGSPQSLANCSSPEVKGRHGENHPVRSSRRSHDRQTNCKLRSRSVPIEPRRQPVQLKTPSCPQSVVSNDLHELRFVKLPALRMQDRFGDEGGLFRQSASPKRLVISHLVQVQLNPTLLEQQLDFCDEPEDYSPPENPSVEHVRPHAPAVQEEASRESPPEKVVQRDKCSLSSSTSPAKHKRRHGKTWHSAHESRKHPIAKSHKVNTLESTVLVPKCADNLEYAAEAPRVTFEHAASSSAQPAYSTTKLVCEGPSLAQAIAKVDQAEPKGLGGKSAAASPGGASRGSHGPSPSRLESYSAVFRRLRYDGEIHVDQVPVALELAGFPKPNRAWAKDIVEHVTEYSTLNLGEFVDFVMQYGEREHEEAQALFDLYDVDRSGAIDMGEISELFESCGITPMGHVIREILKEVKDVGDPNALTFDQFWSVLLHIRGHEGFTKAEIEALSDMFHKFDIDHSGNLCSKELGRVLRYLGFSLDAEVVDAILREVDVDGDGTLDEHEFFVCMRKVRERELLTMKQVFRACDADHSGTINHVELVKVLRKLGYYPEQEEIDDAAEDAGVLPGEEMNFGQLWRFLEAYRAREGFSKADCKELQDCLAQESQDGELDALNVGHLFVRLGLPVSCTQVQRFVANVDIDGSGTIDFTEFIKIARQLSQHVSAHTTGLYSGGISGAAAREMLEAVVPISYHTDISSVVENFQKDHLDHYDCVSCVKQLRSLTRRQVQSNSGFGQSEMEALREQFTEYDKGKSGCLSDPQVHRLLENLFPDLATSASSRPKLLEIMQEATKHAGGAIDFAAFVRLMRNVKDLAELDRIRKERDTVQAVGFSAEEVNEFREFFLGSKDRDFLTLAEVQEMLKNIVPMGAKNTERLSKLFSEVVSERSGRKDADFSEFLLLMRGLMDSDFGCINEHAKRVVFEDLLDDCHSTSARSISKEQARRAAKELLGAFQKRGTSIMRNPDDADSQVKLLRGRHRSATC